MGRVCSTVLLTTLGAVFGSCCPVILVRRHWYLHGTQEATAWVNRALTWLLAAVHGLVVRLSRNVVTVAGVKVFAHRGASTQYAEHTRAAFSHALAVGADGVETDVQITSDGVLVCWHDTTVNRTSDGQGDVQAHTLAQMRALDVHSWKARSKALPTAYGRTTNQLLTLDELTELLVAAGRPVELAVEMKVTPSTAGLIEDAVLAWLQRWGWDATTGVLCPNGQAGVVSVSIMSFSLNALDRVADAVPAARLCPLFDSFNAHALQIGSPETTPGPADLLGPSTGWLAHHASLLRSWTEAGRTVRMWTVATNRQFTTARSLGIQQVTVDDPAWALERVATVTV